jgi:hypothetical protein
MANGNETSQVTIRELVDSCASVVEALRRPENGPEVRAGVEEALSAECVQCGIKLSGAELLKLGEAESAGDSKVDRLKTGYCARNGCDSLYYRLTRAAHPRVDWEKLMAQPVVGVVETEEQQAGARARKLARRHWNLLRIGAALILLVIVLIARQIYVGGTIPFIREPEQFRVDRGE